MKISVALATYNGSRYLREQLDSLAQQTLLPSELVVSDDGSTDDTLQILREFAQSAPFPVRILEKQGNLGFADNFLFCASQCQEDLIAFCDQDDVWMPEKLKTAYERMMVDDSILSIHTLEIVDCNLNKNGLWTQGIVKDEIAEKMTYFPYRGGWGNSMLFKSNLVKEISFNIRPKQPEEERPLSHDTWIYILASAFGRVSKINKPLILYRQYGGNVSQTKSRTVFDKLHMRFSLSIEKLEERRDFYEKLSCLFRLLSKKERFEFSIDSMVVSKIYFEKYRIILQKTNMYTPKDIRKRFCNYVNYYKNQKKLRLGVIKDLVFGVFFGACSK